MANAVLPIPPCRAWATVERPAHKAVRTLIRSCSQPVNVWFRAGTFPHRPYRHQLGTDSREFHQRLESTSLSGSGVLTVAASTPMPTVPA